MTPLIKSGQEHVLSPINLSDVEVGDIVFCKVKGRYYTHLVKAKGDIGKPYKELAKAWNEWIKPIKNTDKTEYLDDYFTDYRWRQAFFRVDDNGLVQSVEQTPKGRRYNISTKQWKENRNLCL